MPLYDTTSSINTISMAWHEWISGPAGATIADRIRDIKADTSMAVGSRNSSLHKKNRHLPQLIESLIISGATAEEGISLMTQIAENYELTLDQVREGARLLAINTAKTDNDTLTAETAVSVGCCLWWYGPCKPRSRSNTRNDIRLVQGNHQFLSSVHTCSQFSPRSQTICRKSECASQYTDMQEMCHGHAIKQRHALRLLHRIETAASTCTGFVQQTSLPGTVKFFTVRWNRQILHSEANKSKQQAWLQHNFRQLNATGKGNTEDKN